MLTNKLRFSANIFFALHQSASDQVVQAKSSIEEIATKAVKAVEFLDEKSFEVASINGVVIAPGGKYKPAYEQMTPREKGEVDQLVSKTKSKRTIQHISEAQKFIKSYHFEPVDQGILAQIPKMKLLEDQLTAEGRSDNIIGRDQLYLSPSLMIFSIAAALYFSSWYLALIWGELVGVLAKIIGY